MYVDYWFIKWITATFIYLGQYRRAFTYLCFSRSATWYLVSRRLGFLSISTLLLVCILSRVRWMVLNDTPCIPWLWLIHTIYVGKTQGLTGTIYVWWIHMGFHFYLNILKFLTRYSLEMLYCMIFPCYIMWYPVFYPNIWLFPPLWEWG